MKLIIEIDEATFKKAEEDKYNHLLDRAWDAIAHGIPLETIRSKIEREADLHDAYVDQDIAKGLYLATRIIEDFTEGEPNDNT